MPERKFTLKEYEDYLKAPKWVLDTPEDEDEWDEQDYHSHWSTTILQWQQEYKEKYGALTEQWKQAIEYVEAMPDSPDFDVFDPAIAAAKEKIPYAISAIFQQISMLFCNYPQPQYISPAMPLDKYAQALNQNAAFEYKSNAFNSLMFDLGMDMAYSWLGVLKVYVDTDKAGPFGKEGRIVVQKMDPAKMSFDPSAKRLKWDDLQFVMYEDDMDIGAARKAFKGSAHKIKESMRGTRKPEKDGMYGHNLLSPVSAVGDGNSVGRDKVCIIECWFKDDREKFIANDTIVNNSATLANEDGTTTANPDYDSDKPDTYDAPELDGDGHVVGRWVPAYPDGRCIILAGDSTVIQDFENPYWHKQCPFVFFRSSPCKKLIGTSDLVKIVKIDKKINDLLSRFHIMAQQEIERPMVADNKSFRPALKIYRLGGSPTSILVVQQGSTFHRMEPTETPEFPWALLQRYDKAMDITMAMAGVLRGDLTEGTQLSAEAVGGLQNMAAGMLKMKVELTAEGMKDLGYQMLWLQRETYDEGIQIPVTMPDGSQEIMEWHEKDASTDYIVDIQNGTGLPGADAAQGQQARVDFGNGLIDRQKALQMCKYSDWSDIVQRMDQEQEEKIETEAAGRAQGLYLKGVLEPENKSGKAGRRDKL